MRRRSACLLVVFLCALGACALGVSPSFWRVGGDVRTEDQNHDGRPDVWRAYDRHGHLARIAVDTNFDGRSDVLEFYESGVLIRREYDRDFNDRVDLVQDFDVQTQQALRAVVDDDFDGTADVLVLFQDGRPVFTKRAALVHRVSTPGAAVRRAPVRTADDALAPLEDPFRGDLAVKAVRGQGAPDDCIELSASSGFLIARVELPTPYSSSTRAIDAAPSTVRTGFVEPYAPRGPPASSLSV